jgi:Tol biopolymer transport system component
MWLAYAGADRNIWLVNEASGEMRQVTQDATPDQLASGQDSLEYYSPSWSSDGQWLAFTRQLSRLVGEGANFQFGLWIYNVETGVGRAVLEDQAPVSFDWQPGSHLLTFSLPLAQDYFSSRGVINPQAVRGIWAVDADSDGQPVEFVKPENGRSLVMPSWSPDGRLLAFEEVVMYEGRGYFAYYDLAAQQYVSLERQVGLFDWSPDGQSIVFDMMVYIPSGTERVRFLNLADGSERALLPEPEQSYAYRPVFSPDGATVAFMTGKTRTDTGPYKLTVQPQAGGEPRDLGVFEYVEGLSWSPDGSSLVFSSGPYGQYQLISVQVADGAIRVLAPGWQPAWRPIE